MSNSKNEDVGTPLASDFETVKSDKAVREDLEIGS